jgi:DNA repair photolyase
MIISASRRTDIPAFYSKWFMNRVRAGFFYRVNPFNNKQVSGFSLKPEDVDAICFWTKNPEPLLPYLSELDQRGFNYYFQFTFNPYGKQFEPHVPPLKDRIATFQELAKQIGPQRVVWRYDPVILTSATPVSWHLEQVEKIGSLLTSSTCRLVFSFYDFYGKGQGRLHAALRGTGIKLEDITATEKTDELNSLAQGFSAVANRFGFRIFTCSEDVNLSSSGIEHGACIDGRLIHELFGGQPSTTKDKNQRQACGCIESVDMGIYNTCHFGCTYCYANFSDGMIENNRKKHFDDSPSLLDRYEGEIVIQSTLKKKKCGGCQGELF